MKPTSLKQTAFMANNIAEIFSLQGFAVTVISTTKKTIILEACSPRRTAECPQCGRRTHRIHQYHHRTINHGYLHDKLILVQLQYRRFRCAKCCRPFVEVLPGISRRRTTDYGQQRLLEDAASMSFRATAVRHGVAPTTVSNKVDDIRYEIDWDAQGKRISLGLDEHSLKKQRQMVTTITNLTGGKRSLLTILPDDTKVTIIKFLKKIPAEPQKRISEICIDMRGSFRAAIEEAWPRVNIVADPFHVVQLTGRAVDDVRQVVLSATGNQARVKRALLKPKEKLTDEEHKKLEQLWRDTAPWPSLKIAWMVKEKIRDLYKSRNRTHAEKKFTLILAYLEGVESRPLTVLRGTLIRWQEQILNHFDHDTSNGFTEGCHTKIKMLKRMSYGFNNRERYKIKMLLGFHPLSELRWQHT